MNNILILAVTGSVVLLLFLLILPLVTEQAGVTNPYEYSLEEFSNIPKEKITYRETAFLDPELQEVKAMALDPNNRVFITGGKDVVVFNGEHKKEYAFTLPQEAGCIAVDDTGTLYAGFRNGVVLFDDRGNRKAEWADLGYQALLTSIAVYGDMVYVADAGNAMVMEFDRSGRLIDYISSKNEQFVIPSPYFDIASRKMDSLWVVNPGRGKIVLFDNKNKPVQSIGFPSNELEGFGGCCNPIHLALLKDGSLVTAEKGIARIKVYDVKGNMTDVVAGPAQFDSGTVIADLAIASNDEIYVLDPKRKGVRIFEKRKG